MARIKLARETTLNERGNKSRTKNSMKQHDDGRKKKIAGWIG
jgi:hypothetical protein